MMDGTVIERVSHVIGIAMHDMHRATFKPGASPDQNQNKEIGCYAKLESV